MQKPGFTGALILIILMMWGGQIHSLPQDSTGKSMKQSPESKEGQNYDLEVQQAINLENELELDKTRSTLNARTVWLWVTVGTLSLALIIVGLIISVYRREKQLQVQLIRQKDSEQEVKLLQEHRAGEEKERIRISRELHDNIGGLLGAANLHLAMILKKTNQGKTAEDSLLKARRIVEKAHQEARAISHRLAPIKLAEAGLDEAVAYFCALVSQKDLKIIYESHGNIDESTYEKSLFIYRSVQELVNNAIRHARCHRLLVQIFRHNLDCEIIVEDDGIGGMNNHLNDGDGIGLKSIYKQVESFHGKMKIYSTIGEGTSLELYLPQFFECRKNT